MNTIPALLESYCNSLITKSLPYESAKTIRTEQLPHEPAVWIPRWPLSSETVFEVIGYALAAYIKIDSNKAYLKTAHGETELFVNDPYEIITEIDTHWPCDLFYPGLLSYDLGPSKLKSGASGAQKIFYDLPFFLALFLKEGYYIDHSAHSVTYFKSTLAAIPSQPAKNNKISKFRLQAESFEQYKQKIKTIRRFIEEGEIYQLNYTLRFSARCRQSGYDFFKVLYGINPAPFSFYIRMPSFELSSNSPERFIRVVKNEVITEPIKGTIRRDPDPAADKALQQTLLRSEKDSAELSMIVDLLRNDLAQVCRAGSVKVEKHKQLHSFSNVHHLISTIRGTLKNGKTIADLLRAAFPGGSITGCPKLAAMRFIAELEVHNRSFYTGSFFVRFPQTDLFDSSILIRTAIKQNEYIHFQAGGGIVYDSDIRAEYEECLAKAGSFFKTLEQMHARIHS